MKVILYADDHIRYKLEGSVAWVTLMGGEEHEINFPSNARVELSALKTVKHIKIIGGVKNVHISKSEIESLEKSFEGTNFLEGVYVRSDVSITNMESSFEGSSVLTFDIPTNAVTNYNKTFKDTYGLNEITVNTSSAHSMNETFKNSKATTINSVLPYKGNNIKEILFNNRELKNISGIDLTNADNTAIKRECVFGSNNIIEQLDISFNRRKISVRKLYAENEENIIDETKTLEMSIDSYPKMQRDSNQIDISSQDISSDTVNYVFEQDKELINTFLPMFHRQNYGSDLVRYTNTDNSSSIANYNFEIDNEHTNVLLDMNYRAHNTINLEELNVDIDFNTADYNLQTDFNLANPWLNSAYRANDKDINTDDLDNTYDFNTYNVEIDFDSKRKEFVRGNNSIITNLEEDIAYDKVFQLDIDTYSSYVDPLGDGSQVLSLNNDDTADLINGYEINYPYGVTISNNKVIDTSNGILLGKTSSAVIALDETLRSSYFKAFSFIVFAGNTYTSNTNSAQQYVCSLMNILNNTIEFSVLLTDYGNDDSDLIRIYTTTGSSHENIFSCNLPYMKMNEFKVITITVDDADDSKYYVYINKENVGNFIFDKTNLHSVENCRLDIHNNSSNSVFSGSSSLYNRFETAALSIYNRPLVQADVDKLNDFWI